MARKPEHMRFFRAHVTRICDVTPSFRRFTFSSDDLDQYGDPGFDERIKIVFPSSTASIDAMPTEGDWYTTWREMNDQDRPPFRTYTTRYVRPSVREVDIDMVVHQPAGPAAEWIRRARVGDELLLLAPTIAFEGVQYGIDFVPPARTEKYLLAGDETAAPAISAILEQLPADATGTVVLEVPVEGDLTYLPSHPGFDVRVGARASEADRNSFLVSEVKKAAAQLAPEGTGADVEEIDVDKDLLWEVPRTAKGGAALKSAVLYAWLAGEASAIKKLRRFLVSELGVDRRAVAFMGYWRLGKPEM